MAGNRQVTVSYVSHVSYARPVVRFRYRGRGGVGSKNGRAFFAPIRQGQNFLDFAHANFFIGGE
jgi:hypothetical protein